MKRVFGNLFTRLVNGGATLTSVEYYLLEKLVASLPQFLRVTVELQFDAYNLVQRGVDGRALNFYRKNAGRVDLRGVPLLEMARDEAPLARLTARIEGESEPVHATLTAVAGRAFCVAFSRGLPIAANASVTEVTPAWRSNFHFEKTAGQGTRANNHDRHTAWDRTSDRNETV